MTAQSPRLLTIVSLFALILLFSFFRSSLFSYITILKSENEGGSTVDPKFSSELNTSVSRLIADSELPSKSCTSYFDQYGAILVYFFGIFYIFVGLIVVCEKYLKESLMEICKVFKIPEDVAGAIFMAAGTSSPELFISILALFHTTPTLSKEITDDIGIGTVVGSTMINLLVTIGSTAIFSKGIKLSLEWRPVTRDLFFTTISFGFLFLVLSDNTVAWWESLIGIVLYVLYCLSMILAPYLMRIVHFPIKLIQNPNSSRELPEITESFELETVAGNSTRNVDETSDDSKESRTSEELLEGEARHSMDALVRDGPLQLVPSVELIVDITDSHSLGDQFVSSDQIISEIENNPIELPPRSLVGWIWLVLSQPYQLLFRFTIPPVHGRFKYQFLGTFFCSMIWLALISYPLEKWIEQAGCILDLSDSIMGVTFLAFATTSSDCLSSVFVGRNGLGTMAVCNALGSIIFDILVVLCVSWLTGAIIQGGQAVSVDSESLVVDSGLLLITVVAVGITFVLRKWVLENRLGYFLYAIYAIFICYSILSGLGVIPF